MAAFEQFLNDKYLSAIHSPLLSTYLPGPAGERDKFELAAMNDNPTLLDFVGSTPAPVTRVLVEFSSVIYGTKQLAFAASWKGPSEQSFLLLFSWWAVCLYGSVFIRCVSFNFVNQADIVISYGLLPLLLLGPMIGSYLPQRWKKQKATPTTEAALAGSLSNLDAVYALKPDVVWHDPLPSELTFMQRLRILGFLLPPFIALTYWVPLRILVAIVGTIVLTYRAPWIVTARRVLSRSAYARATWRYIVGWLSGNTALPLPIISRKKTLFSTESMTPPNEEVKHKFVFTVLENQRWWVGIDWTAALLPSDRPSWCTPISPLTSGIPQGPTSSSTQTSYVPLPPPASFPLPPATSVVLPSPTGKGFMKKTARWQWEEHGEWEVLVHREGEGEVKKLRIPVKVTSNEDLPKGVLAKAAGKMGVLSSPTTQSFNEYEESPTSTKTPSSAAFPADNDFTDQDGWIYGDNKWENAAPKGGMGKVSISIFSPLEPLLICHQFTRFRRWCRIAVLVETEEPVHPDEKTSFTQLEDPAVSGTLRREGTSSRSRGGSMKSDATGSPERVRGRTVDSKMSDSTGQDSSLQKRLKAALKSGT
jgi:hypothetical protein